MSNIDASQLQRGEYVGPIQFRDGSYYLGHAWSMTKSPAVFFAARVTRPHLGGGANNPGNAYNIYVGGGAAPPGTCWREVGGNLTTIVENNETGGEDQEAFYFEAVGSNVIIRTQWQKYIKMDQNGLRVGGTRDEAISTAQFTPVRP